MYSRVIRVSFLIMVVVMFALMVAQRHTLERMLEVVATLGVWAPVVWIMLFALLASVLFPAALLTVAAGTVFGLGLGTLVSSMGSTLGAALAFLAGRYVARDWIESKVMRSRKFAAIDRAVAVEGWKIVVLTRLSPIFPYGLLNYGFGITGVRFWPYVISSWVAMLPGTVLYVFVGTLGRSLLEPQGGDPRHRVLCAIGLVTTVIVVLLVTGVARRAARELVGREHGAHGETIREQKPQTSVSADVGNH